MKIMNGLIAFLSLLLMTQEHCGTLLITLQSLWLIAAWPLSVTFVPTHARAFFGVLLAIFFSFLIGGLSTNHGGLDAFDSFRDWFSSGPNIYMAMLILADAMLCLYVISQSLPKSFGRVASFLEQHRIGPKTKRVVNALLALATLIFISYKDYSYQIFLTQALMLLFNSVTYNEKDSQVWGKIFETIFIAALIVIALSVLVGLIGLLGLTTLGTGVLYLVLYSVIAFDISMVAVAIPLPIQVREKIACKFKSIAMKKETVSGAETIQIPAPINIGAEP